MSGHYKIVCPECRFVQAQCRCPNSDKETRYLTCDACLKKGTRK